MPAPASPHTTPLTVLIDDVRAFKDQRPTSLARTSQEALTLLHGIANARIDHLWLDHDLVGEDTIRPVVHWMVQLASTGSPLNVGQVHVHSANVAGGHWVWHELEVAGYRVSRNFSLGMWTRQSPPTCTDLDRGRR